MSLLSRLGRVESPEVTGFSSGFSLSVLPALVQLRRPCPECFQAGFRPLQCGPCLFGSSSAAGFLSWNASDPSSRPDKVNGSPAPASSFCQNP